MIVVLTVVVVAADSAARIPALEVATVGAVIGVLGFAATRTVRFSNIPLPTATVVTLETILGVVEVRPPPPGDGSPSRLCTGTPPPGLISPPVDSTSGPPPPGLMARI